MKTIIKQQKDGSYIAVISGRIDGNNVSELTRKMTDLTGQIKWLTIDIDGLEHIDSAGIHAFLKIRKIVANNGGTVLLTTPSESVKTIFDIFKFDNLFNYVNRDSFSQMSAEIAA